LLWIWPLMNTVLPIVASGRETLGRGTLGGVPVAGPSAGGAGVRAGSGVLSIRVSFLRFFHMVAIPLQVHICALRAASPAGVKPLKPRAPSKVSHFQPTRVRARGFGLAGPGDLDHRCATGSPREGAPPPQLVWSGGRVASKRSAINSLRSATTSGCWSTTFVRSPGSASRS